MQKIDTFKYLNEDKSMGRPPMKRSYRETKYGFEWNGALVERLCSDDKSGSVISVKTVRGEMQIRWTPTGFIKAGLIKANAKEKQ